MSLRPEKDERIRTRTRGPFSVFSTHAIPLAVWVEAPAVRIAYPGSSTRLHRIRTTNEERFQGKGQQRASHCVAFPTVWYRPVFILTTDLEPGRNKLINGGNHQRSLPVRLELGTVLALTKQIPAQFEFTPSWSVLHEPFGSAIPASVPSQVREACPVHLEATQPHHSKGSGSGHWRRLRWRAGSYRTC